MRRVVRLFHPAIGSHAHVGMMIRLGLSELGYEVRDAVWDKADIAVLDPFAAARRPVKGCLYTAIEGRAPEIEDKKLAAKVVVPSSFAFSMLPQAEYIVPHGVMPCVGGEERDYDFAVSFQTYSELEFHMFRKNIPLLSALSSLGRTICTSAAAGVKCDAYAEPPEVYRRAKYLLFTSFSEGFGLPAAEAMACGTPVVYLDAPAHNEFAQGYRIPAKLAGYKRFKADRFKYLLPVYQYSMEEAISIAKAALKAVPPKVTYDYTYLDMAEELASICL